MAWSDFDCSRATQSQLLMTWAYSVSDSVDAHRSVLAEARTWPIALAFRALSADDVDEKQM